MAIVFAPKYLKIIVTNAHKAKIITFQKLTKVKRNSIKKLEHFFQLDFLKVL